MVWYGIGYMITYGKWANVGIAINLLFTLKGTVLFIAGVTMETAVSIDSVV